MTRTDMQLRSSRKHIEDSYDYIGSFGLVCSEVQRRLRWREGGWQGGRVGGEGDNLLKLVVDFNMERKSKLYRGYLQSWNGPIKHSEYGSITLRMVFSALHTHNITIP